MNKRKRKRLLYKAHRMMHYRDIRILREAVEKELRGRFFNKTGILLPLLF